MNSEFTTYESLPMASLNKSTPLVFERSAKVEIQKDTEIKN